MKKKSFIETHRYVEWHWKNTTTGFISPRAFPFWTSVNYRFWRLVKRYEAPEYFVTSFRAAPYGEAELKVFLKLISAIESGDIKKPDHSILRNKRNLDEYVVTEMI